MATQSLKRQFERIQTTLDVLTPKDPASVKILLEPDPAAGGDSLLGYLLAVRESKNSHDQVFVACFRWDDQRVGQTIDGVRYFASDFAALGARVALLPSTEDNKNALEDVLKRLKGNIFWPGPAGGLPIGRSQTQEP